MGNNEWIGYGISYDPGGDAGRQSVPEKNRNKRRAFGQVSFCLRVRGMTSDVSSSDL